MKLLKIALGAFAAVAFGAVALAQTTGGFWSNWPIVGSASYSCGSVNSVSNCTVPAGPTIVTGKETIPANTGATGGQNPQNVLLNLASLNALPLQYPTASATPANISASNLSGGVVYSHTTTITSAAVTLPLGAIDGQQFAISANRTITTLIVSAAAGDSIAANSNPTVLTASTTVPQGYRFVCHQATAGVCTWYRLQ